MAKKTVKPAQQRTKEDLWRRRMAQQSQAGASSIAASADSTATALVDGETEAVGAKAAATSRRSAGAAATAQRATASAARSARSRIAAASMSLEDEMGYIRTDIRKLVVLTSMCLVVIIALAFILPSII